MIEQFLLHNFKAFGDCSLKLGPLTLLTGMNGVGKSSIIQALALLRQSSLAESLNTRGLLLNGDLAQLGTGRDVLHEYAEENVVQLTIVEAAEEATWQFAYEPNEDVLPTILSAPEKAPLFGTDFQYLRADRISPAAVYEKSYSQVRSQRSLGAQGQYSAHFLAVHRNEAVSVARRIDPTGRDTPGLLAQASAWIERLSPGATLQVADIENTDLVRLAFQYGGSAGIDSSNEYRPTNVGFGLTYVLPVVLGCLSTQSGGIVMIENPEAHLHPMGQLAMGELMALTASDGVQVIVETHSDHVINGVRLAVKRRRIPADQVAVHFFSRGAGEQSVAVHSPVVSPDGRFSEWPVGFFDQWEMSLEELLG